MELADAGDLWPGCHYILAGTWHPSADSGEDAVGAADTDTEAIITGNTNSNTNGRICRRRSVPVGKRNLADVADILANRTTLVMLLLNRKNK